MIQSRLDRTWLGIMVIHSLNVLYGDACCATCCAPCGVIKEMADTGIINFYVRAAPEELFKGSAWWVAGADGMVNVEWLYQRISGEGAECH